MSADIPQSPTFPFLAGGGRMGDLTRGHDWAGSALGSPSGWPPALKITLGTLLRSPLPTLLLWGPDFLPFYNDAFLPVLGDAALGREGRACWPEAWDRIGPVLAGIMDTGEAVRHEDAPMPFARGGAAENTRWTCSFSPVTDEDGNRRGVLCACVETTARSTTDEGRKLQESEARFRMLIEESPVGVCLYVGPEMRIELANDIILGHWEKNREEALGKTMLELMPELRDQRFPEILREIYRTGQTFRTNRASAVLTIDGKPVQKYFNLIYKPLLDSKGEVFAILDMAMDITEQIVAEQQIKESELFARSIIDHSPVAEIVFTGPELKVSVVNQRMLELLGQEETIVGKPFFESIPMLAQTPVAERMQRVLTQGETIVHPEERFELVRYGQPYTGYYNYIYKPLRNTEGHIYGILCTAFEVTEQVLARQRIEEAEQALRGAIELASLGSFELEAGTNRFYASPRLQEWFGFREGEDVFSTGYNPIHPKDRDRVNEAIQRAMTPGSDGIYDIEYSIIDYHTGQERVSHARGKTTWDPLGNPIRLSGTVHDITAYRSIQLALELEVQQRTEDLAASNEELAVSNEELDEANKNLLKSNEELSQYAYVASHDLQEPLRKIQVFSSLLQVKCQPEGEQADLIHRIVQSSERMTSLIRDLLNFSRLLNTDRLFTPVDLNAVVRAVMGDYDLAIQEKHGHIRAEILPVIQGVALQMNQVFYNLVGNALKFSRPGTPPEISITVDTLEEEAVRQMIRKPVRRATYYRISVADNGIGFDMSYAEQIFVVFKRLHGREEYKGSGIGLSLCRRIVENHQGIIYPESAQGEGSVFHIVLPDRHE